MSWLFDGAEELNNKLERGQSFGLTKDQYGALAHVSMWARFYAAVEPSEIRFLYKEGGDIIPGADVILYGEKVVYTVRMDPLRKRCTLYYLPLDSKLSGPGCLLYTHAFESTDYVGDILAAMLQHEGVDVTTLDEQQD